MDDAVFEPWLTHWQLIPDGAARLTATSYLLPVIVVATGMKAMIKITHDRDEQSGNRLMAWWEGQGAAAVIAQENDAILLARATGPGSLSAMSRAGQDPQACRILCLTANRIHAVSKRPLPQLPSLQQWFAPLKYAAAKHGGFLTHSAAMADELLLAPRDEVALHGDLHHDNVLDFGESGWLAIDPKGLRGERGFDFANIFTNPDLGYPEPQVAVVPAIFNQRLSLVSALAGLERERLLKWIIAWCGLSASWSLEDNQSISIASNIASLATQALEEGASGD